VKLVSNVENGPNKKASSDAFFCVGIFDEGTRGQGEQIEWASGQGDTLARGDALTKAYTITKGRCIVY